MNEYFKIDLFPCYYARINIQGLHQAKYYVSLTNIHRVEILFSHVEDTYLLVCLMHHWWLISVN